MDAIAHPKDTEQVEHHVEAVDRRPGEEEDDADSDQDAADQGCQNKKMMLTPIKMLRIMVVRGKRLC